MTPSSHDGYPAVSEADLTSREIESTPKPRTLPETPTPIPAAYRQDRGETTEAVAALPENILGLQPEEYFNELISSGKIRVAVEEKEKNDKDAEIISELRLNFLNKYKRLLKASQRIDDPNYQMRIKIQLTGELIEIARKIREGKEADDERLNPTLDTKGRMRSRIKENLWTIAFTEVEPGKKRVVVQVGLDLDDFRAINNKYGHEMGDDFLILVGQALEKTLRPEDGKAHYSGDEFGACLVMELEENKKEEEIEKIVRDIIKRAIKEIQQKIKERTLTALGEEIIQELSCGFKIIHSSEVAKKGIDDDSINEVLIGADEAARKSKVVKICEENRAANSVLEEGKPPREVDLPKSEDRIIRQGEKLPYSETEQRDGELLWSVRRSFADRFKHLTPADISEMTQNMLEMAKARDAQREKEQEN